MDDSQLLDRIFGVDPTLKQRIDLVIKTQDAGESIPESLRTLFTDVARFTVSQRQELSGTQTVESRKRTKTDDGHTVGTNSSNSPLFLSKQAHLTLIAEDISVAAPARKKMRLEIYAGDMGGIRVFPQSSATAKAAPQDFALRWDEIDQVMCTTAPDKIQMLFNFVVIPAAAASSGKPTGKTLKDALIFTVPATPAATVTSYSASGEQMKPEDSYLGCITNTFDDLLEKYGRTAISNRRTAVTMPDASLFVRQVPQASDSKKSSSQFHVGAHRGSKEGYLYFLQPGIFFGFGKPVSYFPIHAIDSVSYSSILSRTFNLNILWRNPFLEVENGEAELEEVEFAMIDQGDYAAIDRYVKYLGLNDASLAEQRCAKSFNVNKSEKDAENRSGQDGELAKAFAEANGHSLPKTDEVIDQRSASQIPNASELTPAELQRAMEDAEDEAEEDYEPSGGESEGSGAESGDEFEDNLEMDEGVSEIDD